MTNEEKEGQPAETKNTDAKQELQAVGDQQPFTNGAAEEEESAEVEIASTEVKPVVESESPEIAAKAELSEEGEGELESKVEMETPEEAITGETKSETFGESDESKKENDQNLVDAAASFASEQFEKNVVHEEENVPESVDTTVTEDSNVTDTPEESHVAEGDSTTDMDEISVESSSEDMAAKDGPVVEISEADDSSSETANSEVTEVQDAADTAEPKAEAEVTNPLAENLEEQEDEPSHFVQLYRSFSPESIVKSFEKILQEVEIEEVAGSIRQVKSDFADRLEEENRRLLADFTETGADEAAFVAPKDAFSGRMKALVNIFVERWQIHKEEKARETAENISAKQDVIRGLKELIEGEDRIGKAFDQFRELQDKWRSIGRIPASKYRALQSEYHFQVELFYYNININKELKQIDLQKNYELKLELITAITKITDESSVRKREARVKQLQHEWDEIGPVPREFKDEIWTSFRESVGAVYQTIREHYDKVREQHGVHLKAKEELCEKVETLELGELKAHKDWQNMTEKVLTFQEEWKKIGFASRDDNEKVWRRFRAALDNFFGGKKKFYEARKEGYKANAQKKIELCEKAEELIESTSWRETADAYRNLQANWKESPSAGQRDDQKLWKRFRAACNAFFDARKAHFAEQDNQQLENLKKKEALIEEIQKTELSDDPKADFGLMKEFIKRWNEIDFVPIKQKKRIQDAFSKALDDKYGKLKVNREEKENMQYQLRVERMSGSDDRQGVQKERRFLQGKIKELEDTINTYETNLNFFSKSKKTEPLKMQVEKKIAKTRKDLEKLQAKMKLFSSLTKS